MVILNTKVCINSKYYLMLYELHKYAKNSLTIEIAPIILMSMSIKSACVTVYLSILLVYITYILLNLRFFLVISTKLVLVVILF